MINIFSAWHGIAQNAGAVVHLVGQGVSSGMTHLVSATSTVMQFVERAQPFINLGASSYTFIGFGLGAGVFLYRAWTNRDWEKLKENIRLKTRPVDLLDTASQGVYAGVTMVSAVGTFVAGVPPLETFQNGVKALRNLATGAKSIEGLQSTKLSTVDAGLGLAALGAAALGLILLYDRYIGGAVLPRRLSLLITAVSAASTIRAIYKAGRKHRKVPGQAVTRLKEVANDAREKASVVATRLRDLGQIQDDLLVLANLG